MLEYINLGYARLLTAEEVRLRSDITWYLLHHGVRSQTSTTTKVRVVFDGAVKCVDPTIGEEVSINDKLLRGPNYLVNMRGVFNRFHEKLIPVSADIEKNVSPSAGVRARSRCLQVSIPTARQ